MKNLLSLMSFFILIISCDSRDDNHKPTISNQQTEYFDIKKYRTAFLQDKIKESSGLNFFNGKLYTFNDSGNPAEIFEIDKASGEIVNALHPNAVNKDWEALTNDGENL